MAQGRHSTSLRRLTSAWLVEHVRRPPGYPCAREGAVMNSRREFTKRALAGGVVLLAAACGHAANQPAPTSAPAAQPTAAPAAKPTSAAAAPTAAPAAKPTEAAAAKPAAQAPANISGATVAMLQWNHFI